MPDASSKETRAVRLLTVTTVSYTHLDVYKRQCKGYLPIMVWSVDDLRPLLEAHPELAGMRCNQLPDKKMCIRDS